MILEIDTSISENDKYFLQTDNSILENDMPISENDTCFLQIETSTLQNDMPIFENDKYITPKHPTSSPIYQIPDR